MEDLRDLATRCFNALSEVHNRMDEDSDLANLEAYVLRDVNNGKMPNSVSITLNDPAVFAWRVETALNAAIEQINVTSQDKRFDNSHVEDFIRAAFKQADKLMAQKDMFPLNPFTDQQACRRGRVATRCYFRVKDGVVIPDLSLWDTRYHSYWTDSQGVAGSAYQTVRSMQQVMADYPEANESLSTLVDVVDIWTRDINEVWINGGLVRRKVHNLGYVPVVFHKVPMGSMLLDADSYEYQGESVFFLMRDLIPEMNRLVSIIQSINIKAIDQALQLKIPQASITGGMQVDTVDVLTAPGKTNVAPSEGGYQLMPIGELSRQAELLHQMIDARIQRAGLNNFQSGTFTQSLSAVALVEVAQGQDLIVLPRLATRARMKQELAEMLIKQVVSSAERQKLKQVKIGNQTFEIAKLQGDYEIEIAYSFKDPKLDIARASMGNAQRGLIPDKAIRRDTLMRDNPEEDERQLAWERAAQLSPLIEIRRTILKLLEEADNGDEDSRGEAEIMCDSQYLPMLEQAILGKPLTPSTPLGSGPPLVPLLGTGSAGQPAAGGING